MYGHCWIDTGSIKKDEFKKKAPTLNKPDDMEIDVMGEWLWIAWWHPYGGSHFSQPGSPLWYFAKQSGQASSVISSMENIINPLMNI